MRKLAVAVCVLLLLSLIGGCGISQSSPQVVTTTGPLYCFAATLCEDTDISVSLLVTENLSCLHDYSLQVRQMRAIEQAELVILSGAGLEDAMTDALHTADKLLDASQGIELRCGHSHHHEGGHHHEEDPHIWLHTANAQKMAENICSALIEVYPQYTAVFEKNMTMLSAEFEALRSYGETALTSLSCRKIITFHDGFGYFADEWDLTILRAIEEEAGSEASAQELIEIIRLAQAHSLPGIFAEENGSLSAATIIQNELDIPIYRLKMGISETDYFACMYHNINTIKEALE